MAPQLNELNQTSTVTQAEFKIVIYLIHRYLDEHLAQCFCPPSPLPSSLDPKKEKNLPTSRLVVTLILIPFPLNAVTFMLNPPEMSRVFVLKVARCCTY